MSSIRNEGSRLHRRAPTERASSSRETDGLSAVTRVSASVILFALGLAFRVPLAAQPDPSGFALHGEGGLVTSLVLDPSSPSTIFAVTARGIYRSLDAGARWEARQSGLESHSVL